MRLNNIYTAIAIFAGAVLSSCDVNDVKTAPFDNKLYIDASKKSETLALKNSVQATSRTIFAAVAKPAADEININYKVDASLVKLYNDAFYDKAEMLPREYFEVPMLKASLKKGNVRSSSIEVNFKDLNTLSREKTYVLPVTIADAGGMDVLESDRTYFYVLKSMPSISVVADLEKKNYISFKTLNNDSPAASVLKNMTNCTIESLIRVRDFPAGIQSIMGTEGKILLRISDNGLAPNQLQLVTPSGNMSSDKCMLPANKWVHIAATFDATGKQITLYIDGEVVVTTSNVTISPISFGKDFYIGYSYARGRELDGEVSECRIWNIVRTQEQIQGNFYEVEPNEQGLVAYWKFNDSSSQTVRDYTGNGNEGQAASALKWTKVSLPEVNNK